MIIGHIEGATRILGKQQGYLGLPIRDEIFEGQAIMTSAWTPTPVELALLMAGASIYVTLFGTEHPPIKVQVGEVPR